MANNGSLRAALLAPILYALAGCGGGVGPETKSISDSESVLLGKKIFEDTRLSSDGRVSCSTCHSPSKYFGGVDVVTPGSYGRLGARNAPSLLDVAEMNSFFWDGRASTLEEAVLEPFTNPTEHGAASLALVLNKIWMLPDYKDLIRSAGEYPDADVVAEALSAYLLSLDRGTTRFEMFLADPFENPLSPNELSGLTLFKGKAKCASCHGVEDSPAILTDNLFHHTGVGFDSISDSVEAVALSIGSAERDGIPIGHVVSQSGDVSKVGRFAVDGSPGSIGAFRTPTLRNISNTAPYMHDGSVRTLSEAIDHELYYRNISTGRPISLTVKERHDLLIFLKSLEIVGSPVD